ncbi:DUF4912 domain-containing protein [Dendronalium sp. ChiSLP03b]|uniref:DUF4912 domain-containing protein n=1 Tax=Dendronalium sp. ChiSLP03b TaxID=3075381 RepID=UPI002AD4D608|nr:DUF4912 domain-containing protein [Dendronalium sp. ChiSLP03b]MDZ8207232.1 DUF4912 domain-containing protein [Dendronalium sp. ChiSLP03b]
MWQQEKKDSAIVNLALLLALATAPMAANLFVSAPLLAQSATDAPSFPLPQTVENGTTVRIDGSNELVAINQSLKQSFEKQFSGTKVEVAANGTDAAIKAVQDGNIDVAAIGRGLTPEEKAQGLEQVRLYREKIAIIVSKENPFKGSLTDRQFARIFRGRIKNWSQVGGAGGQIRVIDRPTTSEIRTALSNYPVFRATKFATGSTATQLTEDNTAEIIKQLGKDGISYAVANEVSKLSDVRVLPLHQTLPNDPKYPFSQPLVYVYKKNPSPAIASFLGFTLASPGQKAIEEARAAQADAIANGKTLFTAANPTPNPETTPAATATPNAENTLAATATPNAEQQPVVPPAADNPIARGQVPLWWLLLPLAAIVGLLAWFLRSSPSNTQRADNTPSTPKSPTPEDNTSVALPVSQPQTPSNLAVEHPTTSNLSESTNPTLSNTGENTTLIGGAALAAGAGAAIWSTVAKENNQKIEETTNLSNSGVVDPYDIGESPWDIEAPAAVVNTSYPQILDVSKNTPNVEPPAAEVTNISPDQPDIPIASAEEVGDLEVAEEPTTEQPQAESNWLEDITSTNATLAPEAAASTWSSNEETDDDTIQVNPAELPSTESDEVTPDLEWPTAVFSDVIPEQPVEEAGRVEEARANIWPDFRENTDFEVNNDITEFNLDPELALTEFSEATSDEQWPEAEMPTCLPVLPDIPEETLNVVADEAEPTEDEIISNPTEETENVTQSGLADFVESAALTGVGIGSWATVYGIQDTTQSEVQAPAYTNENIPTEDETAFNWLDADDQSSIVLTPRTFEWADVSWHVSETDQQTLRSTGSQLALRLYDVTGLDLSYQSPQLVQQYVCELATHEHYIAIPAGDRDYITEIGYVTAGDWVTLASSAIVRVFNPAQTDSETALLDANEQSSIVLTPRTFEWADVSWYVSETDQQILRSTGFQLALRLYDVTGLDLSYQNPQLVQQYICEATTDNRSVAIPKSDRDYITEIGYVNAGDWVTLASSAIVRVFNPAHTDSETALLDADEQSSIILTPRTFEWADVSWHVSETDLQALRSAGSQLALLLYDVTDLDLSYQNPRLIQQYVCEATTDNRSVAIPKSDRDYITEIGYVTDGGWVTLARSAIVRVFSPIPTDNAVDLLQTHSETALLDAQDQSSVVLTPGTFEWAEVSWHVSEPDQQVLQNADSQLNLRMYDVTGLDLSYQSPQLVQQYTCEAAIHKQYVAIPTSDRDYITEIGYVTDGSWVTLAHSAIVRVFSPIPTDNAVDLLQTHSQIALLDAQDQSNVVFTPRTPKWAYVSWQISDIDKQALQKAGSQLALRLYDVTGLDLSYQSPQLVQQYACELAIHDQYIAISKSDRDYITEIGYVTDGDRWVKLAQSTIVRLFSRPSGDFWFVADAELIIHGATEPGATVNIAGNPVTLKSDGTFHLRIPFSDDFIDYLMTAVAANGEETKTIHKKFSQDIPETEG